MASTFPFAAIVGQDEMTLAIQVVAIDPTVGGVLVLGDRGTGKSTAVRALADLLPPLQVVKFAPTNAIHKSQRRPVLFAKLRKAHRVPKRPRSQPKPEPSAWWICHWAPPKIALWVHSI